jgi:hypothetical protein
MFDLIHKYLILNKKASLPTLGIFSISRLPAQLNFEDKKISPPTFQINFTAGSPAADKYFYKFIENEQKVEEIEAITELNNFSQAVRQELNRNKFVLFPGIGELVIDVDGVLRLQTLPQTNRYYSPVIAETTQRNTIASEAVVADEIAVDEPGEITEEVQAEKRDYWWIFAVILALIAIAGIAYYYYLNGSFQ